MFASRRVNGVKDQGDPNSVIQTRRKGTAGKALGHGWTDGRGSLSRICWIFVGSSEAVVSLLASIPLSRG